MTLRTEWRGFGAPTVHPAPVAAVAPPQDAAASPPGIAGVEVAPVPGGAVVPGTDGTTANDAAREPGAAGAAQEAAPPPAGEEGGQHGAAPPGGLVEDCGEMVPAEWGDDDPRFARILIASRKLLAAADLARGRDTEELNDAKAEFPEAEPDGIMHAEEWTRKLYQHLIARGRADLAAAEQAYKRLGFATYPCEGPQGGFLAIGFAPEAADIVREWDAEPNAAHWLRDTYPQFDAIRATETTYADVPVSAFREAAAAEASRPGSRILRVDASDAFDADESDRARRNGWQKRHPAEVKWRVRVPAALTLAPDEGARNLRERLPKLPETQEQWQGTKEAVGADLESFLSALEFNRAVTSDDPAQAASVPQLVKGLLPVAMVSVLVGESGSGKSTLAHQLAAAIGSGAADFLGYEIPPEMRSGGVAIIVGEETRDVVAARARRFLLAGLPHPRSLRLPLRKEGVSLATMLADLEKMPNIRLIVVDPAAVWLAGKDEDASGPVGEFLSALMDFAQRTGAAVLVLHHPRKGHGYSIGSLLDAIRGSGVWIDRPRVVLGLAKGRGGQRTFGVIKSNLAPDIVLHEVRLDGDEDQPTLWRRAEDGAAGRGGAARAKEAQPHDDAPHVTAAVAALRAKGERVNRTGDRSLFERQPAPLPGWTRSRVGAGVAAALAAGLLVNGPDGLAPPG